LRHTAAVPRTALLIIDMLNPYEHEDAEALVESVRQMLPGIVRLRDDAAGAADTVTVYVNDNNDHWDVYREEIVEAALQGSHPDLVEPIAPRERVPFIVKGRHSIFYQTAVDHFLRSQDVQQLVLAGQVTEQCILYSALDAYIRGYDIVVPRDAVAHIDADLARGALAMMKANMHAEIASAAEGQIFG
jgi:nicotinamidase-related amidase